VADFALSYTPLYSWNSDPGSSVNIVTWRWAGRKDNLGCSVAGGTRCFTFPPRPDRPGSLTHWTTSPVGTAAHPSDLKRPGRDINCSSVFIVETELYPHEDKANDAL
jgi:hypothetical protein